MPQIKRIGMLKQKKLTLNYNNNEIKNINVYSLNSNAQDMLAILSSGLNNVGSSGVYLSEKFANKLSGDIHSLVGKTLYLEGLGAFNVEKIIKLDDNLSIKPDVITSFDSLYNAEIKKNYGEWYDTHLHLIIDLVEGFDLDLKKVVIENAPQIPGAPFTPESFINLTKRSISNIHYESGYPDELGITFSKSNLYIIYSVCLFSFILGCVGFINSVSVLMVSQSEKIKVLLSLGASCKQITIEAITERKLTFFVSLMLTIIVFIYAVNICSKDFAILSILSISDLIIITGAILVAQTLAYIITNIVLINRIVALQNKDKDVVTGLSGKGTVLLNRVSIFVQMLVTSFVVFISISIAYDIWTAKTADFGYNLEQVGFTKMGGINDPKPTIVREQLNSKYGNITEVASWHPFDKSSNYISISSAKQKIEESNNTVNFFYAGREIANVLGLSTLASNKSLYDKNDNDKNREDVVKVIVTESFTKIFKNIEFEQVLNHSYYGDFGTGRKKIQVVEIVNDFYLGKAQLTFVPIMIVVDSTKANSVIFNKEDVNIA